MVPDKVPGEKWPVFVEGLESFSRVCTQRALCQQSFRPLIGLNKHQGNKLFTPVGLGKGRGPFVKTADKRALAPTQPDPPGLLKQGLGWGGGVQTSELCKQKCELHSRRETVD